MAAEYILKEGNRNVMLCERGIRTFETAYRYTLDLQAVPGAQGALASAGRSSTRATRPGGASSWLPMSLAAAAAGADGIIVEVHPNPDEAICDGPQALPAEDFAEYAAAVERGGRARGQGARHRVSDPGGRMARRPLDGRDPRRRADRRLDRPGRARARGRAGVRLSTRRGACCERRTAAAARSTRRPTTRGAVRDADVVFVADARRSRSARPCARRSRHAGPDCVVSDVGSTKRHVARARARPALRRRASARRAPRPRASEHAREDLFDGATWYLTPGAAAHRPGVLYERLHRLLGWQLRRAAGAAVRSRRGPRPPDGERLAPAARARQRARRQAASTPRGRARRGRRRCPGPSFRDATRVAGANSAIWTDIYLREPRAADRASTRSRAARAGPRRSRRRRAGCASGTSGHVPRRSGSARRGSAEATASCASSSRTARRDRRDRARAGPRGRQHRRPGALTLRGQPPGGRRAVDRGEARSASAGADRELTSPWCARERPLRACAGLHGELRAPADKSISHRAALLGAMASEPVRIDNYLHAADTAPRSPRCRRARRARGGPRDGVVRSAARGCARRASRRARSTSATPAR